MIDPKILTLIRCPLDGQSLELATAKLITHLNEQIEAGELRDRAEGLVQEPMDAALVTADGKRVYPARGGIPTLVVDNAIEISSS